MWKPYGTIHSEVVENTKMGTLRYSNIHSSFAALLYYPCGRVSDDYMCSVKCLWNRCLLLPLISKDCANRVYIIPSFSKNFTSIENKMCSGYTTPFLSN